MRVIGVALVSMLATVVLSANDWTAAVDRLKESVVYLESSQGSCTAFSINEEKNYVLTAAHCFDELPKLYVDLRPVTKVVARDTRYDLLVLEVKELDKPALPLAKSDPAVGDTVGSRGYGYGLEDAFFKVHHVASNNTHINENGMGGPYIVVDTAFVGGMSGGPVVNTSGEVISIVQYGNDAVGFGVGCEIIRDKVGRYFQFK